MTFDIELSGDTYRAELPESFAMRDDLVSAAADNWRRASCAALGLCCEGLNIKATYRQSGFNPLVYGGRVLDELADRGLDRTLIVAAGMSAWSQVAASMISEPEVKEEEAFLKVTRAS